MAIQNKQGEQQETKRLQGFPLIHDVAITQTHPITSELDLQSQDFIRTG